MTVLFSARRARYSCSGRHRSICRPIRASLRPCSSCPAGSRCLAFAAFLAIRGQIAVAVPLGAAGLGPARLAAVRPGGLWRAHAEERGPGLARALRLPRNGARSRQRRDARRDPGGTARGHARLTALDVDDADRPAAGDRRGEPRAYWQRILTAGMPAGVSTRRPMRQRGGGSAPRGPMTHEEAYQILGLEPGAKAEEIVRAHRTLMKTNSTPTRGARTILRPASTRPRTLFSGNIAETLRTRQLNSAALVLSDAAHWPLFVRF